MRTAMSLVLASALLGFGAKASAQQTLVLAPSAAKGVKARHLKRAARSMGRAVRNIDNAASSGGMAPAADCALRAACIGPLGAGEGADRVMGAVLSKSNGAFVLTLVLADVATGEELARAEHEVARRGLPRDPGAHLAGFLSNAPARDTPPIAATTSAPLPPPAASPPPAPAEQAKSAEPQTAGPTYSEPVATGILPPEVAEDDETPSARAHALCMVLARGGVLIPRGDLGAGPLLGLDASVYPLPELPLGFGLSLGWSLLTQKAASKLGPPSFPRAQGELIQQSSLFTVLGGARYSLLQLEVLDLHMGAAAGAAISRTEFEAFGSTGPQNDVAFAAEFRTGVHGDLGTFAWMFELAWREVVSPGDAVDFGESTVGGLVTIAGVGASF